MRTHGILAAIGSLALLSVPAAAATANNSQAGAWGGSKSMCKPTPYFQGGGCLSSFVEGRDDGWVLARPDLDRDVYAVRPPLRPLDR